VVAGYCRVMAPEPTIADRVEMVRRANEAFNNRDVDAWLSFFSPDIAYRPVATFTDSEERRGLGAMRRFMNEWHDVWADDFTAQTENIQEHGDAVIVLLRFTGHARASGVEIAGGVFQVYRFHDGKIASAEDFTDRNAAVRAAEGRG
jgi:ketosteroid isomerase-like protein